METQQQDDRMSVSLAWKDFFGEFSGSTALLIMAALCNKGPLYFCPVVSFYLLSSFYLSFFLA